MALINALYLIYGMFMDHSKNAIEVSEGLRLYGDRIRTARVRRRWSKQELALRAGVERRTIARLEEGDGGIGLGCFLTVLWVLGLWDSAKDLAAPESDTAGAFLEKQRQPRHVHPERNKELDF
jgi:transcriptional regulator with XRE-family HTH domain